MYRCHSIAIVLTLSIAFSSKTAAQVRANAMAAAAAQGAQAHQQAVATQMLQAALERQRQDERRIQSLLGINPALITTIGLWPSSVVPCKLPKRERPYDCQRLLVGPALLLSRLVGEFVVARGDHALAQGQRSWWADWDGAPLALAEGEVLYHVGSSVDGNKDLVATVYRPYAPPQSDNRTADAEGGCKLGEALRCQTQCEGGNSASCLNLAKMYEDGNGIPKNIERMVQYYKMACEQGETSSCTSLGNRYQRGIDVPADPAQAVPLYQRACGLGSASGCALLGGLYEEGNGVAQDRTRASELYEKACKNGSSSACQRARPAK